jgi:hypothetical protein
MGLVLSYKQFQLLGTSQSNISKPKSETTTMKLKTLILRFHKRTKKNTGVMGLAILFLSLAFFFLYLKYVYQIEIVETELKFAFKVNNEI